MFPVPVRASIAVPFLGSTLATVSYILHGGALYFGTIAGADIRSPSLVASACPSSMVRAKGVWSPEFYHQASPPFFRISLATSSPCPVKGRHVVHVASMAVRSPVSQEVLPLDRDQSVSLLYRCILQSSLCWDPSHSQQPCFKSKNELKVAAIRGHPV